MSDIPPIGGPTGASGVTPSRRAGEVSAGKQGPGAGPVPADQVEISEMGQLLSTLELDDDVRAQKVIEIREAIANGTYETEDKLENTVERLIEVLRRRE